MIANHRFFVIAMLLFSGAAGCGEKPGIDAEQATAGGPRQNRVVNVDEDVQFIIKSLENAEPDEATIAKMGMKMTSLVVKGAAAEPALPVLRKIRDEWDDDHVRDVVGRAIEKIEQAVEEKNQQ